MHHARKIEWLLGDLDCFGSRDSGSLRFAGCSGCNSSSGQVDIQRTFGCRGCRDIQVELLVSDWRVLAASPGVGPKAHVNLEGVRAVANMCYLCVDVEDVLGCLKESVLGIGLQLFGPGRLESMQDFLGVRALLIQTLGSLEALVLDCV